MHPTLYNIRRKNNNIYDINYIKNIYYILAGTDINIHFYTDKENQYYILKVKIHIILIIINTNTEIYIYTMVQRRFNIIYCRCFLYNIVISELLSLLYL